MSEPGAYGARVRRAVRERLLQAARAVGVEVTDDDAVEDDAAVAARVLSALVARRDAATLWLAWVAVATTYPSRLQLQSLLAAAQEATAALLLDTAIPDGAARGDLVAAMSLVEDSVIVDVDYAATNDHNSGIQRVVRSASARWAGDPTVVLAAALGSSGALRSLTPEEHQRTANWGGVWDSADQSATATTLIVPWRSRVLFPEVPAPARLDGLSVLGEFSGNATAAIGHDAIPITGRQWVSRREAEKFGRFLPLVRHLDLVIGVSATAAADFGGISRSMAARGEPHPEVVACPLPVITRNTGLQSAVPDSIAPPLVLVVGSREPRKNQDAVVFAAERLWRAGLDFELLLIGSWGWSTLALRRWLRFAVKAGRPVSASASSDADLWSAYERAAFTVFPSLQEGFGLPVAESLSRGIPAITSGYGSMAEVAAGGGCLTVDPRDDDALFESMRRMLVEPGLRERLGAEARGRPEDSWRRWADDVLGMVRTL